MPTIPILTDDSFRILHMKKSNPSITAFEIASKTNIPVQDIHTHLQGLRQAKPLPESPRTHPARTLRVVK